MKTFLTFAGLSALSVVASAGSFVGSWNFSNSASVTTAGTYAGSHTTVKFDTVRTGGSDTLLPQAPNHFVTFCAELNQTISGGSKTHDDVWQLDGSGTQNTWTGNVFFTASRTLALEKMWGYLLGTTTSPTIPGGPTGTEWFNPTSPFTAQDYAAFQLAQWEIMFDTNFSLGAGGTFRDNGTNATIRAKADNFLAQSQSYTGQLASVFLLRGGNIQDQITGSLPPVPGGNTVPEPFTMGLGIAAVGAFIRRRAKAAKA